MGILFNGHCWTEGSGISTQYSDSSIQVSDGSSSHTWTEPSWSKSPTPDGFESYSRRGQIWCSGSMLRTALFSTPSYNPSISSSSGFPGEPLAEFRSAVILICLRLGRQLSPILLYHPQFLYCVHSFHPSPCRMASASASSCAMRKLWPN